MKIQKLAIELFDQEFHEGDEGDASFVLSELAPPSRYLRLTSWLLAKGRVRAEIASAGRAMVDATAAARPIEVEPVPSRHTA